MKPSDAESIKDFWQGRASTDGVPEDEVTHRDVWQRHLEIELMKRFVRSTDRVLDVGCGNGYTTRRIGPLVREIIGVDYSEEMITRAMTEGGRDPFPGGGSPVFHVKDVLDLTPIDFGLFDLVISERCLINLDGWANQKRAISNIASVLRPGGRFLFVEGSRQGRARLNELRRAVGLEAMPPVWHNLDFDEEETLAYLHQHFVVKHKWHFGIYDFISRVVHPLIVAPSQPQYDCRINEIASRLAMILQEFESISRMLFLVLQKEPLSAHPAH